MKQIYLYQIPTGAICLIWGSDILDADKQLKYLGFDPTKAVCSIHKEFVFYRKEAFIVNESYIDKERHYNEDFKLCYPPVR